MKWSSRQVSLGHKVAIIELFLGRVSATVWQWDCETVRQWDRQADRQTERSFSLSAHDTRIRWLCKSYNNILWLINGRINRSLVCIIKTSKNMLNGQNEMAVWGWGGEREGNSKVYKIIAHFARHLSGFYEWTRQWLPPCCHHAAWGGQWLQLTVLECQLQVACCKLQVAAMRKVAIKTRTASTERAH